MSPWQQLVELTAHPRVVAIGEAGLDYFYQKSSREDQQAVFRRHIAAARETGLPLVIHARDADEDAAQILREEMAKGPFKAVLHCYTGGRELAETGIELGFYVSFSGILTFPKLGALRELAAALPLDRLLVETDAPFLAPHPHRGKRNEPAFVRHTAKVLAEVKGVSEAELDKVTTANFFTLFSKAETAVSVRGMTLDPAESMTHRITPHPVLLPMGEGTPELTAAESSGVPSPMGRGTG